MVIQDKAEINYRISFNIAKAFSSNSRVLGPKIDNLTIDNPFYKSPLFNESVNHVFSAFAFPFAFMG